MNSQLFQQTLAAEVSRLSASEMEVTIQSIKKNNGVVKNALCIHGKEKALAPVIYTDGLYERFRQGVSIEHLAKLLLEQYHNIPASASELAGSFQDFSKIRKHLYCRVVNYELNAEQLDSVIPCKRYMDLAFCCYLQISDISLGQATITVTEAHCRQWGMTYHQIFPIAWENTVHDLPAHVQKLEDILREAVPEEDQKELENFSASAPPLYVLSNQNRCLGAICIMYPNVLKELAQKLRTNLYILPSSIHECILVPESGGFSTDELNEMIRSINRTQLEPQEVLSDHAYFYNFSQDAIRQYSF